jgi:hypothetical protein
MEKINKLKQLLTPYDVGHTKKRYGVNGDGGYVLSETLINNTRETYSLGISTEFNIDLELAKKGIKVYQYDMNNCSVPKIENLFFKKLMINNSTLMEEISSNNTLQNNENLLLMDIEGGEYDVVLNRFNCIEYFNQLCIEVHFILNDKSSIQFFEKLNEKFTLIHIHANNWSQSPVHEKYINSSGVQSGIPDLLELTYVRNDTFKTKKVSQESCPTNLDFKNFDLLPEITMDWWIK